MDKNLLEYTQQYTTPESGILFKINRETHLTQTHPQMLAGPMQGMLLQMISRMIRPKRILEIGTFTGYSAICLAAGLTPPYANTWTKLPWRIRWCCISGMRWRLSPPWMRRGTWSTSMPTNPAISIITTWSCPGFVGGDLSWPIMCCGTEKCWIHQKNGIRKPGGLWSSIHLFSRMSGWRIYFFRSGMG